MVVVLAPFLQKLVNLMKTVDKDVARWQEDGKAVIVLDPNEFEKCLKTHFKGTINTFVRQLHFYGFKKMEYIPGPGQPQPHRAHQYSSSTTATSVNSSMNNSNSNITTRRKDLPWVFSHVLFRRDQPELLKGIRRRNPAKNANNHHNDHSASANSNSSTKPNYTAQSDSNGGGRATSGNSSSSSSSNNGIDSVNHQGSHDFGNGNANRNNHYFSSSSSSSSYEHEEVTRLRCLAAELRATVLDLKEHLDRANAALKTSGASPVIFSEAALKHVLSQELDSDDSEIAHAVALAAAASSSSTSTTSPKNNTDTADAITRSKSSNQHGVEENAGARAIAMVQQSAGHLRKRARLSFGREQEHSQQVEGESDSECSSTDLSSDVNSPSSAPLSSLSLASINNQRNRGNGKSKVTGLSTAAVSPLTLRSGSINESKNKGKPNPQPMRNLKKNEKVKEKAKDMNKGTRMSFHAAGYAGWNTMDTASHASFANSHTNSNENGTVSSTENICSISKAEKNIMDNASHSSDITVLEQRQEAEYLQFLEEDSNSENVHSAMHDVPDLPHSSAYSSNVGIDLDLGYDADQLNSTSNSNSNLNSNLNFSNGFLENVVRSSRSPGDDDPLMLPMELEKFSFFPEEVKARTEAETETEAEAEHFHNSDGMTLTSTNASSASLANASRSGMPMDVDDELASLSGLSLQEAENSWSAIFDDDDDDGNANDIEDANGDNDSNNYLGQEDSLNTSLSHVFDHSSSARDAPLSHSGYATQSQNCNAQFMQSDATTKEAYNDQPCTTSATASSNSSSCSSSDSQELSEEKKDMMKASLEHLDAYGVDSESVAKVVMYLRAAILAAKQDPILKSADSNHHAKTCARSPKDTVLSTPVYKDGITSNGDVNGQATPNESSMDVAEPTHRHTNQCFPVRRNHQNHETQLNEAETAPTTTNGNASMHRYARTDTEDNTTPFDSLSSDESGHFSELQTRTRTRSKMHLQAPMTRSSTNSRSGSSSAMTGALPAVAKGKKSKAAGNENENENENEHEQKEFMSSDACPNLRRSDRRTRNRNLGRLRDHVDTPHASAPASASASPSTCASVSLTEAKEDIEASRSSESHAQKEARNASVEHLGGSITPEQWGQLLPVLLSLPKIQTALLSQSTPSATSSDAVAKVLRQVEAQ